MLFILIYFIAPFTIFYIPHNYVIPQAVPHAIPETHSAFYPHRRFILALGGIFKPLRDKETQQLETIQDSTISSTFTLITNLHQPLYIKTTEKQQILNLPIINYTMLSKYGNCTCLRKINNKLKNSCFYK